MKQVLNNLFEHKTLSQTEAKEVLFNIATEKYNASQVSAFMSVYLMRSITVEELSGFRDAMLELCLKTEFDSNESIDIVGTGGDGKDTFNISTLACFVVAGAGVKVTKHGNYGVSSISGSSNVLEQLGIRFTNVHSKLMDQLDKTNICFLHAPLFHPTLKKVAALRKELGFKTFFNILGPLVNPAQPTHQYTGVYSLELGRLYSYLLQGSDINYSIVHSLDNYDEVSLTASFKIITNQKEQVLAPEELGLKKISAIDLHGGSTVDEAAKIFLNVLQNNCTGAQKNVVIINSALAIHCAKPELDITEAMQMAEESLISGNAYNSFKKLQSLN